MREFEKAEGLQAELDEALNLMVRVARGEQTVERMGEWVSLNFPRYRDKLPESVRALPPAREK